jgi:hypothetical protein
MYRQELEKRMETEFKKKNMQNALVLSSHATKENTKAVKKSF